MCIYIYIYIYMYIFIYIHVYTIGIRGDLGFCLFMPNLLNLNNSIKKHEQSIKIKIIFGSAARGTPSHFKKSRPVFLKWGPRFLKRELKLLKFLKWGSVFLKRGPVS